MRVAGGLYFADPGNPQSLNLYSYVMNNPLIYIDPTGLDCISDTGATGGSPDTSAPPDCADDGSEVDTTTIHANGTVSETDSANVNAYMSSDLALLQPGTGTDNSQPKIPNKPSFTILFLPPGALNCSAIFQFHAPPGFNLNAIVAAGKAGGLNPFSALAAVGHYGSFDFQRSRDSADNTTFYSGYTDASNVAVGAYLYGAGFSNTGASVISNTFAKTMSANAGSPQQADYRNLGYDLAAAGWNPSCH